MRAVAVSGAAERLSSRQHLARLWLDAAQEITGMECEVHGCDMWRVWTVPRVRQQATIGEWRLSQTGYRLWRHRMRLRLGRAMGSDVLPSARWQSALSGGRSGVCGGRAEGRVRPA